MASITISDALPLFPSGTTVKAFPFNAFTPNEGKPAGAEAASAAVASDGSLNLTGLTAGNSYILSAEVSGTWRYLHAKAEAPTQGFFGVAPVERPTVNKGSSADEINTALKSLGLLAGT